MSEQINAEAVAVEAIPAQSQSTVGEQLSAARQARGLTVAEIAQALKLGVRQVDALESGDWQLLPGLTFVRGFVRNYARLVQIDPAPLMTQLDAILKKPVNTLGVLKTTQTTMPQSGGYANRRDRAVVLAGVGLVALAALIYFLIPNDLSVLRERAQSLLDSLARKEETVQPTSPASAPEPVFPPGTTPQQIMNPQATPVVEAAPGAVSPSAETSAVVDGAPQMRFVFDKDSWLEVRDRDNKLIFSQRGAAGAEQTLSGQGPLSLIIGYAPGVRVFWHGQAVDLAPHTRGDVARLVLE